MSVARSRLAVVSDAVYPWNTGGKEVRHHELLTRLVWLGFDVDVYTMHWWSEPATVHREFGITYHAICRSVPIYAGSRRSITQAVVFALATVRLLFRRFDVVEVDAIPFLHLFPMRLVAWARRRPMVVTWHEFWGVNYWAEYLGVAGRVAAALERFAIRLPDRLVVASEGTARRLQEQVPGRDDLTVIPNGIDLASFSAVAPAPGAADVIVVGRLLEHKNVDVALGAIRVLRDGGHDLRLRIIGDGPESEALTDLALRLGVSDIVEMPGFVDSRTEVLEAIAGAKVLLFPSVREGFGMVALEAMALGTPVVTSDHPDNFAQDLVSGSEGGVICAPTVDAFADAVKRILNDPDSGARGREVARSFDWDRMAERVMGVYVR